VHCLVGLKEMVGFIIGTVASSNVVEMIVIMHESSRRVGRRVRS
jgi:hypothetical protein